MQTRDAHLDFLRGCAIVLVVIGHYLQGAPDFDSNFAFRLIYAFHMPLFMFICGLAAAHGLGRQFTPATALSYPPWSGLRNLPHRAARLLLPFLTWAVVAYFVTDWHSRSTFPAYMLEVVARPDLALWFLPVLFCIYVAVAFAQFIYRLSLTSLGRRFDLARLIGALAVSWLLLALLRAWFAMTLASYYFPFFTAGFMLLRFRQPSLSPLFQRAAVLICLLAFACLLPFWNRTGVDPELLQWFGARHAGLIRALVAAGTASFGIVTFVALTSAAKQLAQYRLHAMIRYLGLRTLPIYAMHLYFIGLVHNFLAIPFAIITSLGADWLLQRNRWTQLLLLGEVRRPADSMRSNPGTHEQQMAASENRQH